MKNITVELVLRGERHVDTGVELFRRGHTASAEAQVRIGVLLMQKGGVPALAQNAWDAFNRALGRPLTTIPVRGA